MEQCDGALMSKLDNSYSKKKKKNVDLVPQAREAQISTFILTK